MVRTVSTSFRQCLHCGFLTVMMIRPGGRRWVCLTCGEVEADASTWFTCINLLLLNGQPPLGFTSVAEYVVALTGRMLSPRNSATVKADPRWPELESRIRQAFSLNLGDYV